MTNKTINCRIDINNRHKLFARRLQINGTALVILDYVILPSREFTESPVKKTFWRAHDE